MTLTISEIKDKLRGFEEDEKAVDKVFNILRHIFPPDIPVYFYENIDNSYPAVVFDYVKTDKVENWKVVKELAVWLDLSPDLTIQLI